MGRGKEREGGGKKPLGLLLFLLWRFGCEFDSIERIHDGTTERGGERARAKDRDAEGRVHEREREKWRPRERKDR
jgi:hypothetical protein